MRAPAIRRTGRCAACRCEPIVRRCDCPRANSLYVSCPLPQAVLLQTSRMSSLLWTSVIAINVYRVVFHPDQDATKVTASPRLAPHDHPFLSVQTRDRVLDQTASVLLQLEPVYHSVSWGVPVVMTVALLAEGGLGPTFNKW